MSTIIYRVLKGILTLNDKLYGAGATREVLRDLAGEWRLPECLAKMTEPTGPWWLRRNQ